VECVSDVTDPQGFPYDDICSLQLSYYGPTQTTRTEIDIYLQPKSIDGNWNKALKP
jgi:hypothetical protein